MRGVGKVDVQLDVSSAGNAGRLEMIEGRTGRVRIAAESLMPGAQVTDAARKHGATRWQVYDWRRRLRDGRLAPLEEVSSLPAFAALVDYSGRRCDRAVPGVEGMHLSRVIRAVRAAR